MRRVSAGSRGWSAAVGLFKYFFTLIICPLFEDLCVFNTKVLGQQGVICLLYKSYRLRSFGFLFITFFVWSGAWQTKCKR